VGRWIFVSFRKQGVEKCSGDFPSPLEAISHRHEGVKKSTSHVIPSEARNLHLFVLKEINAAASLRSELVTFLVFGPFKGN
jgi:hypothetical protein